MNYILNFLKRLKHIKRQRYFIKGYSASLQLESNRKVISLHLKKKLLPTSSRFMKDIVVRNNVLQNTRGKDGQLGDSTYILQESH